jgi:Pseudouridylate synthases, 23S RNA-specific
MSDYPLESREPRIIYEDEDLVAILKPSRMHSAPGKGGGDLCAWAFERFPELGLVRSLSPCGDRAQGRAPGEGGLLHRLDYETSGLVLFARNDQAFAALLEQQAAGLFHKEYAAFCRPGGQSTEGQSSRGDWPAGSIPARGRPIGVDSEAWDRAREAGDSVGLSALLSSGRCAIECSFRPFGPGQARVACMAPGRPAARRSGGAVYRSELVAAAERSGGELELRMALARGFRHQLRAQLAWIGLPISGDSLYGGASDERLRLYAIRLTFFHPAHGESVSLSSPSE